MAKIGIRPATTADATHLAAFVDMASEGLALHLWERMRQPGQTLFEIGRSRALREEGSFSYRNAHMADVEGVVAGALVGYQIAEVHDRNLRVAGDQNAPAMPAFVEGLIELESMAPLHWYVNVLAIYPEYRGQGVGKALLAHADKLGRETAAKGMALIVASENAGARRLYEKSGYRETARRPLVAFPGFHHGGDWVLMTKACG
jgi:ribosomal protein S18 acetylase RimI-like enzyme